MLALLTYYSVCSGRCAPAAPTPKPLATISAAMFKFISVASHAGLLAFFIYLQAQGASMFGSDEAKPLPGAQRSAYHK